MAPRSLKSFLGDAGTATKSSLKVGFVSYSDPMDRKTWSGTTYYMYKALKEQFDEVIPLGPINTGGFFFVGKFLDKISRRFFKISINYSHNFFVSKLVGWQLIKRIKKSECDVIFAPANATAIASLNTDVPICYLSDTSVRQISCYYPKYKQLSSSAKSVANQIEDLAIKKAKSLVYPSRWAADYVVKNYKIDQEKLSIIPFGANIDHVPCRSEVLPKCLSTPCRILFLGVDWERKGGSLALDTIKCLLRDKMKVELVVCGCVPPVRHESMTVIPFLDKKKPEEHLKVVELLKSANFLLLPTRADAFGIVFCEASAYALPSITTATGGTEAAVENGINGYTLPYNATGEDYASVILEIISDKRRYMRLCESSRDRYENVLNWSSWAVSMREVLTVTSENSSL